MVVPLIITRVLPAIGTRRGVWPTLLGVVLGVAFERFFKPSYLTMGVWKITPEWPRLAIASGIVSGLVLSVIDGLGRGAPIGRMVEQIWIPLYRAVFFSIGLTMIRKEIGRAPMIDRSEA